MRKTFQLVLFLAISISTTQAQQHQARQRHGNPTPASPPRCYYKGIDTCIYKVGYNKNGTLLLFTKNRMQQYINIHMPLHPGQLPPPPNTDLIPPDKAVDMIANYIQPDIDASHVLLNNMTRYVDFDIQKLISFYVGRDEKDYPDMLRIYLGKYGESDGENRTRISLILVGCKGTDDMKDDSRPIMSPVNMGNLCPVNCDKTDFTKDDIGDIYGKLGAKKAGATSRL